MRRRHLAVDAQGAANPGAQEAIDDGDNAKAVEKIKNIDADDVEFAYSLRYHRSAGLGQRSSPFISAVLGDVNASRSLATISVVALAPSFMSWI